MAIKDADQTILFTLKRDIVSEFVPAVPGDYPLHYHDHFEMEMVTEGHGSVFFNGQTFPLNVKDICLLRPLDYHKNHCDTNMMFEHVKVRENVLPKWILNRIHFFKNPVIYHLSDKDFATFSTLFGLLADEFSSSHGNSAEASTILCELIFTYFFRLDPSQSYGANENFIMKVTYFLQHNNRFTEKVSLDEIAEYTGYSKYYTSSMFHKLYGSTIQDYIVSLRIEYAKKLIIQTDYSMTEIIMESGFPSTSNFYQKFTKLVGCSPLQFKKKWDLEKQKALLGGPAEEAKPKGMAEAKP
jgi:AraC-like DNA-binding protein